MPKRKPANLSDAKDLGKFGEKYAASYLRKKGYKILGFNYSCKLGEIDVLAKDKDCYVFVEVKSRKSLKYGYPEEAVNDKKLAKIKRTVEYYLMQKNLKNKKVRIEVVSLLLIEDKIRLRHIVVN